MRFNPLLNPHRKRGVFTSSLTVRLTLLIKSKQLRGQILDKNKFKNFFYSFQEEIIPLGMPTDICAFSPYLTLL